VARDATLEEDLLAAPQVLLGNRQRIGRQPVAAVDLGEVGRLCTNDVSCSICLSEKRDFIGGISEKGSTKRGS
jgi:hypothetical protein